MKISDGVAATVVGVWSIAALAAIIRNETDVLAVVTSVCLIVVSAVFASTYGRRK